MNDKTKTPKGATAAFWQPCPVSWTVLEVFEAQAIGRDLVAERFAAGEQVRRRRLTEDDRPWHDPETNGAES